MHHALVPPTSLRWEQSVGDERWLRANVVNATLVNVPRAIWNGIFRTARAAAELHVVVLGTSSTNGCGACDFSTFARCEACHRPEDRSGFAPETAKSPRARSHTCLTSVHTCVPAMGWASLMEDDLRQRLKALSIPSLRMTVWAKSAVAPGYFARCTESRWVPKDAHVVLLEVTTNLFHGSTDLPRLLARVRQAAPSAAIAFVMWPPKVNALYAAKHPRQVDDVWSRTSGVGAAATSWKADVLRVHLVLAQLPPPIGADPTLLYAQRGADRVHPNPLGHELLAAIATQFLVERLRSTREERERAAASIRENDRPIPQAPSSEDDFEHCYEANGLPLQAAEGWRLVDEGVRKGIPKMGWRSSTPGTLLIVGPIVSSSNRSCDLLSLELDYHLKHSAEQGTLHLNCSGGCECIQEQSLTQGYNPWPYVVTDAHKTPIDFLRSGNLSVTTSTRFFARWWQGDGPCLVTVRHVRGNGQQPSSTVRVDGLSVHRLRQLPAFFSRMNQLRRKYAPGFWLLSRYNAHECGRTAILDECRRTDEDRASRFCHDWLNASAEQCAFRLVRGADQRKRATCVVG